MSTRNSPEGKGGRCVRLTTYHPCSAERQEIRGLNLPGPPWAISTACCGRDLYLYLYIVVILTDVKGKPIGRTFKGQKIQQGIIIRCVIRVIIVYFTAEA